jgi:hypothetical protein
MARVTELALGLVKDLIAFDNNREGSFRERNDRKHYRRVRVRD